MIDRGVSSRELSVTDCELEYEDPEKPTSKGEVAVIAASPKVVES